MTLPDGCFWGFFLKFCISETISGCRNWFVTLEVDGGCPSDIELNVMNGSCIHDWWCWEVDTIKVAEMTADATTEAVLANELTTDSLASLSEITVAEDKVIRIITVGLMDD